MYVESYTARQHIVRSVSLSVMAGKAIRWICVK